MCKNDVDAAMCARISTSSCVSSVAVRGKVGGSIARTIALRFASVSK